MVEQRIAIAPTPDRYRPPAPIAQEANLVKALRRNRREVRSKRTLGTMGV